MNNRPASINACEKLMPGIGALWDSIGDLPRQFKNWYANFKKNIEWKNKRSPSSLTNQETQTIAFFDIGEDPVILEEEKGFLRVSGQHRFIHLSPELAGKFAKVLSEYSITGKLPNNRKLKKILKD